MLRIQDIVHQGEIQEVDSQKLILKQEAEEAKRLAAEQKAEKIAERKAEKKAKKKAEGKAEKEKEVAG